VFILVQKSLGQGNSVVHLLESLRSIIYLEVRYEPPLTATTDALKESQTFESVGQKSILIEGNVTFFGRFDYSQNARMQMCDGSALLHYAILRPRIY
jgi:hypothetical protein